MNPSELPEGATLGASQDPFEVAATMFGLYSFQLEKGVKHLEPTQLRVLLLGLLTQPLNEQDISMEPAVKEAYNQLKTIVANRQANLDALTEKLGNLSTGELRRLVNAIVQFPLADKDFIGKEAGQLLKDCFSIGARLMEAKTLMFIKTLSDYEMSEMEKKSQNGLVPEVSSNNNVQDAGENNV